MKYPRYKIEITKYWLEERKAGKEWALTGKKDEDGDEEYAYTPEIMKERRMDETIFEQTVEDLNIGKVIQAVNQMDN